MQSSRPGWLLGYRPDMATSSSYFIIDCVCGCGQSRDGGWPGIGLWSKYVAAFLLAIARRVPGNCIDCKVLSLAIICQTNRLTIADKERRAGWCFIRKKSMLVVGDVLIKMSFSRANVPVASVNGRHLKHVSYYAT